jgi:hypothetical protein
MDCADIRWSLSPKGMAQIPFGARVNGESSLEIIKEQPLSLILPYLELL